MGFWFIRKINYNKQQKITIEFHSKNKPTMSKYTRLISALIILVSIIEISCVQSSKTNLFKMTEDQKKVISENTTNELPQALPASLNPPDHNQTPISYYDSYKTSISNVIDIDSKNPENLQIMFFSQLLGYTYMILMVTSAYVPVKDSFKIKSSRGLSKNILLIHQTGCLLLMFNNIQGFLGETSCKNEVHITDVMLSFFVTLLMAIGLIKAHVLPCNSINKFSYIVIFMCIASIQTSVFICFYTNLQITTIANGIIKLCFVFICYLPQYILIYKLKTTKGFSILPTIFDITACSCGILQIVVDYYATGNGTGFWHELNWGKFLNCQAIITGNYVLLFQHCYYRCIYELGNLVVARFDEVTFFLSDKLEDIPNEFDIKTESKDIFGVSRNRMNSDLVLKKLQGNVLYEGEDLRSKIYGESDGSTQSQENLRCLNSDLENALLNGGSRCNADCHKMGNVSIDLFVF